MGTTTVYSEPLRIDDSTTVVLVSRQTRSGGTVPLGALTTHDGATEWTATPEPDRLALAGIAVGFVAATLACVAMVRRPPWPDAGRFRERRGW